MITVSIIIPVFNREAIIPITLQSILSQSYTDFECIVVDDHSTDATAEVIKSFARKDLRVFYGLNERKKGAQGARNTGLMKAKGKYILFFDSDNKMNSDFLFKTSGILEATADADICTVYSNIVNQKEEITGKFAWICNGKILEDLLEGKVYVDFNSALIRKTMVDKIGFLDEACVSYQEYDTFIRLAADRAEFRTISETLVDYYRRDDETISSDLNRDFQGFYYILKKHRKLWLDVLGIEKYKKRLRELSNRTWKLNQPDLRLVMNEIPEFAAVHRRQNFIKYFFKIKWLLNK